MAEKIAKSHLIGLEQFWSVCVNNFKIQNMYVKNITFACSLPMSTSTCCSDYHIGPARYMGRELKSENINIEKAPLEEVIIQQKIHNHPIIYNQVPERY
jgi:hypothetical protein